MDREERTYKLLSDLNIDYKLVRHEAVYTIAAAKDIDERLGLKICKNLFLSSNHGENFYLLFMPVGKRFNTGRVSKQVGGGRMTFGTDEKMLEFLDITPGSVSPMGLMNDKSNRVRFLVDKDVLDQEFTAMHPCVNTATIVLRTKDLLERFLPAVNHDFIAVEID